MLVSHHPVLENLGHIKTCKPTSSSSNNIFTGNIPVVDLSDPTVAKTLIVNACKEFGFFKVINHGVSIDLPNKLEAESVKFFKLPKQEKEKSGPPNPFGYAQMPLSFQGIQESLQSVVNEYVIAVRNVACEVLEMIAEELQLNERDTLSSLIRDEKSDAYFRLNHYPPCPDLRASSNARSLIGFGEHTDPQIMSVLRSNDVSGFQICLKDGAWVSIPPDPSSFFLNVGDSLQVMTNGRFRSVKHRVLASDNNMKSRVSMIYFGGPPLTEKITPLREVMEEGEESLYKEYTWSDYKKSAYETKLSDNRLDSFLK
ncbi:hypothetical protein ABFX02_13G083900 [Erythranthe guttata]